MIAIHQVRSGVTVELRLQPKASRDRVVGEYAGKLKVAVTAPPEHGRANEALIKLLAGALGISKSCVSIIAGARSRDKTALVEGLSVDEAHQRISSAVKKQELR